MNALPAARSPQNVGGSAGLIFDKPVCQCVGEEEEMVGGGFFSLNFGHCSWLGWGQKGRGHELVKRLNLRLDRMKGFIELLLGLGLPGMHMAQAYL